jgi:NAD+ synthase (glutamine-hydrolysing)
MTNLTIGLAQTYPKLGDISHNVNCHIEMMEQAAGQGAELVIFPELSLTGYNLKDLVSEVALTPDSREFKRILDASKRLKQDVMFGFVDVDKRSRFYIAAAYISHGEVLHIHHKVYLPTYHLFEDGRFFAWGDHIRAFDTRFGRVGMLICEDFWHVSPPYLLWLDGADILLLHSASPGRGIDERDELDSSRWVEIANRSYGNFFTNYVVHCARVGFEDGFNFTGGSTIVDPNGEFVLKAPYFDEALLIKTIDLNQLRRTRARLPLLRDERTGLVSRELARILSQNS